MRPPRQDRCLDRLAQAAVLLEDSPVVAHREDLSRDAIVSVWPGRLIVVAGR